MEKTGLQFDIDKDIGSIGSLISQALLDDNPDIIDEIIRQLIENSHIGQLFWHAVSAAQDAGRSLTAEELDRVIELCKEHGRNGIVATAENLKEKLV